MQARSERNPLHDYIEWRGIDLSDVCERCGGAGMCAYANTSTWRHGMGGQAITNDVCDVCWGSGSESRHWPSWRVRTTDNSAGYRSEIERLRAERDAALDAEKKAVLALGKENERLQARVKELETGIRKFLNPTGPEAFGLERLNNG